MSSARENQALLAARWHRLLPVNDLPACPRVVAGLDCHASADHICLCQKWHHVLDHGRLWRRNGAGGYVLTGEPYGLDGHELAEFLDDMHVLGLGVSIGARSPWNRGNTVLIRIRRNNEVSP